MLDSLIKSGSRYLENCEKNYIRTDQALRQDLVGMRIYDDPIFSVGDAHDPLFAELKNKVIDPSYLLPDEWLPGSRRVISFFLPFSKQVKQANAVDLSSPCMEWLHARIEGEELLRDFRGFVRDQLIAMGFEAVAPILDQRFKMVQKYASNWSERHTAYICGLGTFGMSKGIITAKGMAGRLGSVVTNCELPVTPRPYADIYEYCIRCGKCARNCPARAIDSNLEMNDAKKHPECESFVMEHSIVTVKEYYGCGKCQVKVPCQDGIPLHPNG